MLTDETSVTPAENGTGLEIEQAERPSWLPEGISSQEELVEKYVSLVQKQGQQQQQEQQQNSPVDFDAYYAEYSANGSLSKDSYASLASKGLSKEFVDQYIEGQIALNENQTQKGYAIAGGKEAYGKMVEWAKASLSPQEIQAFNAGIKGSVYQMQLTVQGLHAKYQAAVGSTPNLLQGNGGATGLTQGGFRSTFEMISAINDPRYLNDNAYRSDVERRISLM